MDAVIALVPTAGVAVLFYFVIRAILRADRNERNALKRLEQQYGDRNPGT